jgi:histone H3/H4
MADIPNAVVKRLLSKHGGGLRVSGSAVEKAAEATESYIASLAQGAQASAEGNRRKTIMDEDVEVARSKIASSGAE